MNARQFTNDNKRKLLPIVYLLTITGWGIYTLTYDYSWQALMLFAIGLLMVIRNYYLESERIDEKIASIAAHSVIGVVILDQDLRVDFANKSFSKLTGYTREQLNGENLRQYGFNCLNKAMTKLGAKANWKGEIKVTNRFGDHLTLDTHITHYKMGMGMSDRYVLSFRDISHRVRLENKLKNLAEKDPLTGCWNRRRFDKELARHASIADRYAVSNTALVIIDIDHFKQINDKHGHDVGDEVIKDLGNLMKAQCRETDIVARVGGEEFAIIMPETNTRNAFEAIYRLKEIIQSKSVLGITISGGITTISRSVEQSYRRADKALYRAKTLGRNRVCSSEDESIQQVSVKAELSEKHSSHQCNVL
ncbi:sensor domain-containing diguanylate cyclase [Vibrio sp. SCSIO 43155]|uniref:sensor domain-containing diguanylate cyclase n=1 Tax=Vibrio sp. SCSIO 43155 TaxID=2819099 RepID=UPI0020764E84|nr:sensor domain-containing diguanylate cyclase [Vibrio sp. SCSIO 43155]USD56804.1 sensor domain-containing diguanylate cyclase [Vibrio sp. SCSIO 43155]